MKTTLHFLGGCITQQLGWHLQRPFPGLQPHGAISIPTKTDHSPPAAGRRCPLPSSPARGRRSAVFYVLCLCIARAPSRTVNIPPSSSPHQEPLARGRRRYRPLTPATLSATTHLRIPISPLHRETNHATVSVRGRSYPARRNQIRICMFPSRRGKTWTRPQPWSRQLRKMRSRSRASSSALGGSSLLTTSSSGLLSSPSLAPSLIRSFLVALTHYSPFWGQCVVLFRGDYRTPFPPSTCKEHIPLRECTYTWYAIIFCPCCAYLDLCKFLVELSVGSQIELIMV
jgi:hypothetical protein